jgi:putative addiction module component (TIGR02574 family)
MAKVSMADVLQLSVAAAAHPVTLTEAQREELDFRLEDFHGHPDDGIEWEFLKCSILKRGQ